jgi:hypothetical protein
MPRARHPHGMSSPLDEVGAVGRGSLDEVDAVGTGPTGGADVGERRVRR